MGLFDKFKKNKDRLLARNASAGGPKKSEFKAAKAKSSPSGKDLTLAELKSQGEKDKQPDKGERKVAKKVAREDTKEAYRVLLKPLVTEKGTYLGATNKYLFAVSPQTNKTEIKKAVKAVYGVMPVKVNIVNLGGKNVRYGRVKGQTKDKKKAIITLKKGDKIEVYEGV